MKTITSVFYRPIVDTPWYHEHEAAVDGTGSDYIKQKLLNTNYLKQTRVSSMGGHMITTTNVFTDEGFSIWFNDPVITGIRQKMIEYNKKNDIMNVSLDIT